MQRITWIDGRIGPRTKVRAHSRRDATGNHQQRRARPGWLRRLIERATATWLPENIAGLIGDRGHTTLTDPLLCILRRDLNRGCPHRGSWVEIDRDLIPRRGGGGCVYRR